MRKYGISLESNMKLIGKLGYILVPDINAPNELPKEIPRVKPGMPYPRIPFPICKYKTFQSLEERIIENFKEKNLPKPEIFVDRYLSPSEKESLPCDFSLLVRLFELEGEDS